MKIFKNEKFRFITSSIVFTLILSMILSLLSMIYKPKWRRGRDTAEMKGFYAEPDYSLDYLLLGSCNIYSSFSPTMAYDWHGITGYNFSTPDQELSVSYHYLKEALKNQDIKVVVLEALMLMAEPNEKRERYNRFSLDYMPMSLNKLGLIIDLAGDEQEYMASINKSTPSKLLTYAGYIFPVLRYHARDDISERDYSYYYTENDYSELKGGFPGYSYAKTDSLDFSYYYNGDEIRDISRKYFKKIKQLCEDEGIELLLVNSPNHFRWKEEQLKTLREFVKEEGVEFIDFFSKDLIEDYKLYDISNDSGRLNIYGMTKYTKYLSQYLVDNYKLEKKELSAQNMKMWDDSVEKFYESSSRRLNIYPGEIAQVKNEKDGISIRWNTYEDSNLYEIWRSPWESKDFEKIASIDLEKSSNIYIDRDVENSFGYSYYVKSLEGKDEGSISKTKFQVFVEAAEASIDIGSTYFDLSWNPNAKADGYSIYFKQAKLMYYTHLNDTKEAQYRHEDRQVNIEYDYWIKTYIKTSSGTYYSAPSKVIGEIKD